MSTSGRWPPRCPSHFPPPMARNTCLDNHQNREATAERARVGSCAICNDATSATARIDAGAMPPDASSLARPANPRQLLALISKGYCPGNEHHVSASVCA